MLVTKRAVTTSAGINLQLRNMSGEQIEFTKLEVGSGIYSPEEVTEEALRGRTALKSKKQQFGISSLEISSDNTTLILSCLITNAELKEGYTIRELGLYAQIQNQPDTEQLVSISLAEIEDAIPAYNGETESRILMKYQFTVSDSDTVSLSYEHDPVALAEDVEKKYAETMGKIINPNLLINPDFKINTSWAKSWSGVEQYTVNNWMQFSNIDGTVSIVDDGISLDNTNGYITFGQSVENGDLLAGETVTLSALVMQVSDNTPSGIVYVDVDGETLGASNLDGNLVKDEWVLLQTTVVLPPEITDNLTAAVYMSDTIGSIVIRWMKLEVGDRVTKFISPVYAEELAKCQLFNELLGKSMPLALTASRTVYVDATNGSDDTGDGTQEKPWKTIQRAVDECPRINSHNSRYTIKLAEGVYDEIVRVVNMHYSVIITGADDNLLESCQKYKIYMIAIAECPFVIIRGVYMYGNDNTWGYGVVADRGIVEVQYCKFDGCGISAGLGGLVRAIHTDLSNYQKNYGALYCSGGDIRCYDLSGSNNTIAFGAGVNSADSGAITVAENCTITASTIYKTAFGGQIRFGSQGWQLIGSVTGANSVAIDSEKYTEFLVSVDIPSAGNVHTIITNKELGGGRSHAMGYYLTSSTCVGVIVISTSDSIELSQARNAGQDVIANCTMTVYGRRV